MFMCIKYNMSQIRRLLEYQLFLKMMKQGIVKQKIQKSDGTIKQRIYQLQEKLGSGGFAQCYLVERKQDKKHYAMKIIPKTLLTKPKAKQKMISQIKLHRTTKHKNICQLERAFEDEDNVYMLLELCKNKNMFELIKRRKRLTIPQTQFFIYQLIDALCYLHNRQVVHRDIKLGNLLIDQQMNLKLADFGLATKIEFVGDRKHTVCGTPNYIAPQIIMSSMGLGHSGHSYEVDVWSTGVIMYIMLIGRAPFETAKVDKTYLRICQGDFGFPESFKDESAKDLLCKILVTDLTKRYTFQKILNHPFMNPKAGIPKELPPSCMINAPKFGIFEKYAQEDVKESARNASITSIRSSMDVSIAEQDQNHTNSDVSERSIKTDRSKGKSKQLRGLLRSVLSTSSMSKSLQKLNSLTKNTPQKPSSPKLLEPSIISNNPKFRLQPDKVVPSQFYITHYKREVVNSYKLSNGIIGTYQSNNPYKMLYNPHNRIFYEVEGQGQFKKVKYENAQMSQNISNRIKFIQSFMTMQKIGQNVDTEKLIYLKRVFQVKAENLLLFKFSNDDMQALNYETNYTLLLGKEDLILIQLKDGKEITKVTSSKQKYVDCKSKILVSMFLKVKKILYKVSNIGKQ